MPRATLSAAIALPLVPLPPGSTHHTLGRPRRGDGAAATLVSVGSRADARLARPLFDRRDLRSRRRDRGRRRQRAVRGARRPALPGGLPLAARDRDRKVFGRRRDRRALEQDDPPAPARLRGRGGRERRRSVAELGPAQVARSVVRKPHVETRRDPEAPPRAAARAEDARESGPRRLRLDRRARRSRRSSPRNCASSPTRSPRPDTPRTKTRTCARSSAT